MDGVDEDRRVNIEDPEGIGDGRRKIQKAQDAEGVGQTDEALWLLNSNASGVGARTRALGCKMA